MAPTLSGDAPDLVDRADECTWLLKRYPSIADLRTPVSRFAPASLGRFSEGGVGRALVARRCYAQRSA